MKKVLIVDDELDVQILFKQKFRRELSQGEFEFHYATSGDEALNYLKSLNPFDVVILLSDINMPGMTGLELLKKSKDLFPFLNVIMVSAYGDKKNYDDSITMGASDFITKPVNFELLKNRLTEVA